MTYIYAPGDKVRLIGGKAPLEVVERYWLRGKPWYGVKTAVGFYGIHVGEDQIEAYTESGVKA